MGTTVLLADAEGYLYFVRRALLGMRDIVLELGDEPAGRRPELPGANTAYGVLNHCLGVTAYWGGQLVAGRPVERDRAAEFGATGTVAELARRVDLALAHLAADLNTVEPTAPLREAPASWAQACGWDGPDRDLNQSSALIHLYEELAQHHGQLQVLRDVVLADRAHPTTDVAEPIRPAGSSSHDGVGFDAVPLAWLRRKQSVKWSRPGPDLLPCWVAETDFPVAPVVEQAVLETLERGDLGYPDWAGHPLAALFAERMRARYGWRPDPGQVRGVTDLIQALQIVLSLGTAPGDGVVTHLPTYPPFLASVASMGRTLLPLPLEPDGASGWALDPATLARAVAQPRARVLLLVNPHNPTGRVFSPAELGELAEAALRHDLIIVSDEIHAELIHAPYRHTPIASLGPEVADRTVTITSASKAFNVAGLRTALAHVGPPQLRAVWDRQPPDLFGALNVLGVAATRAAWTGGDRWLAQLNQHLLDRRDQLVDALAGTQLRLRPPQAGYLAWIDARRAGLPGDPAAWFREHAAVELNSGPDYGPGGQGYARLNFATTSVLLGEIVDRMLAAIPAGVGGGPAR